MSDSSWSCSAIFCQKSLLTGLLNQNVNLFICAFISSLNGKGFSEKSSIVFRSLLFGPLSTWRSWKAWRRIQAKYILKTGDPNNIKKNKWIERYKEGKTRNKCWLFLIVGKDHYYNRRRRDPILTKSAEKLQEVSELGETGHPEEFRYKPPSIGETRHPRRKCLSVESTINSDIHLRRVHSRPNFR